MFDVAPQVLSSSEFALRVGFWVCTDGSARSRRVRQIERATRAGANVVNSVSVRNSSGRRPLKLSTKPFCIGLPGAMECHSTLALSAQPRITLLVNSLPLSLTIILGLPRSIISRLSSRATRMPPSEVSATSTRLRACNHPRWSGCGSAGRR